MKLGLESDEGDILFDIELIEALLDSGFWMILHMILLLLIVVTAYPLYWVAKQFEQIRRGMVSHRKNKL